MKNNSALIHSKNYQSHLIDAELLDTTTFTHVMPKKWREKLKEPKKLLNVNSIK